MKFLKFMGRFVMGLVLMCLLILGVLTIVLSQYSIIYNSPITILGATTITLTSPGWGALFGGDLIYSLQLFHQDSVVSSSEIAINTVPNLVGIFAYIFLIITLFIVLFSLKSRKATGVALGTSLISLILFAFIPTYAFATNDLGAGVDLIESVMTPSSVLGIGPILAIVIMSAVFLILLIRSIALLITSPKK